MIIIVTRWLTNALIKYLMMVTYLFLFPQNFFSSGCFRFESSIYTFKEDVSVDDDENDEASICLRREGYTGDEKSICKFIENRFGCKDTGT